MKSLVLLYAVIHTLVSQILAEVKRMKRTRDSVGIAKQLRKLRSKPLEQHET